VSGSLELLLLGGCYITDRQLVSNRCELAGEER
jgi:hypothetical protein